MGSTLRQLDQFGREHLLQAGIEEAYLDARYLLFHAFKVDTVRFLMEADVCLGDDLETRVMVGVYESLIEQRKNRVPLQYLMGYREFMGLSFLTRPHVLIPRQDTECLVEWVLQDCKTKEIDILDVCTGSGCIALSLAILGGYQRVEGVDVSIPALELALENKKSLCGNDARITFYESDLLTQLQEKRYHVIVSNPPYIPTRVIQELAPEVRDYEPWLALDGKEDGLYFYRELVACVGSSLHQGGCVYFEIGHDQAQAVRALLEEAGFSNIEVRKDESGHDRVIKAVWLNESFIK